MTAVLLGGLGGLDIRNFALTSPRKPQPLAEEGRRLLQLPQDFFGKGYDIVDLLARGISKKGEEGAPTKLSFMLDTGLTTSLLLPDKAQQLGLLEEGRFVAEKLLKTPKVVLENVEFSRIQIGPLRPFVMDFFQSRMGNGATIDGMLGMEFFERFAVDLGTDVRLYEADDGDNRRDGKHDLLDYSSASGSSPWSERLRSRE